MTYIVNSEIQKIASIKGKTEAQVAEDLRIRLVLGDWTAFNRGEQSRVTAALRDATPVKNSASGIVTYTCHECGAHFKAPWVSKYSSRPVCPICGETTMISY